VTTIRRVEAPLISALTTKSRRATVRVALRTTRTISGNVTSTTAAIADETPGPRIAATRIANSTAGNENRMSATRTTTSSENPPR
jgi:hypothetical protein